LIARLGATAVAGHQIVANLVALLFMMPLSLVSPPARWLRSRSAPGRLAPHAA
jgi:MATE family multidrug resistance protein